MAGVLSTTQVSCVAVTVAYVFMVVFNILANTNLLSDKSTTQISNENPTYVTPDGITFAIWGFIYLLQLQLVVYQFGTPSEETETLLQKRFLGLTVRWRIVIFFLMNATWLPVFNKELFWVSQVIIVAYLGASLAVYRDLRPSKTSSFQDAVLLTAGISANLSLIVVASCMNMFVCLGEAGWKNEYGVAGTPKATIVVGAGVALIAIERVLHGKDVVYGFVTGWALLGVYRMQTTEDETKFPSAARDASLASTAASLSAFVWCIVLLGVAILTYSVRDSLCKGLKAAEAPTTSSPAASPKGASTKAANATAV